MTTVRDGPGRRSPGVPPRLALALIAALLAVLGPQALPAQRPSEPTPAPGEPDQPPAPRSGEYDWLHFKNGEWLKGELKEIQDGQVVFESDELGEFNLDLDDVHEIYTSGVTTVMRRDRARVEGALRIEGERVTIEGDDGAATLQRNEVRSVIAGRPTELNFWSGKLGSGVSLRRGNVNQTDLSATVRLQRRTPASRLSLRYDGAYSLLDGERTANNHRAEGTYDLYVTDRLFVRPAGLTYFRDEFQNIDYRITPHAGFGYDIIDRDRLTWTAGPLIGWQFERFIDVPPGQRLETNSSALLGFTTLEWEATSTVDVGLGFNFTAPSDELQAWNARTTLYADVELTGDLDFNVQLIWDRSNRPTPNADGSVPEKNDVRLFVGLNYSF